MARKHTSNRPERLAKQILQLVAGILLDDIRDPRVDEVQLTDVEVTGDLRHAKVYYVLLDARERDEDVQAALDGAAGFVRRAIAPELRVRHVPQLTFVYDESIEHGRRMERLLDGLHIPREPQQED
ncbi:MAG: 30S ribosome-binding factor RbfA [Myxococcota bacterium]